MGYILELRRFVGSRPLIMTGAAVIVRDSEGRLLLQRRADTGDWGTIGGSMEPGETFEETAARELYEEAWIAREGVQIRRLAFRPGHVLPVSERRRSAQRARGVRSRRRDRLTGRERR